MPASGKLPLRGIRVLDLTRVVAGPVVTKQMADLGADVVKIESIQVPDETRYQRVIATWPDNSPGDRPWNSGWYFNNHNRNKRDVTIDISSGWGQDLILQLVKLCDVVTENYRPGVLDKVGLSYEALKAANPDIIMVSMSGFGHTGPFGRFRAYGVTVEAQSGLGSLNGTPNHGLTLTGQPYADWCTGMFSVSAVLMALDHRRRTGEGQRIDISQAELMASLMGEAVAGYGMTGQMPTDHSNRHPWCAPHGYFRCAGEDEWIGIAVEDEARWSKLCQIMDRLDLIADPRFVTATARKRHEDELDAIINAWTSTQDKITLFHHLQNADIAAGPVHNGRDVLLDPQLRGRDYWERMTFPPDRQMPPLDYARYPLVLDGERPRIRHAAPDLGEHNQEILGDLMGFSAEELEAMEAAEVIGTVPLSTFDWSPLDIDFFFSTGAAAGRDLDYRQRLGLDD